MGLPSQSTKHIAFVMKKLLTFLLLLFYAQSSFSQLNIELVSRFEYDELTSDVWGYTAPDGTEYALVGLHHGISIVSLEDPANPVEVFTWGGDFSKTDMRSPISPKS